MSRYSKALVALVTGVAGAGALLPTDAPVWLLGVGVAAQTLTVWAVPNRSAGDRYPRSTAPRERPY